MNTLRAANMVATMLVGVAIVTAALGLPRTSAIVLSAVAYLLIRNIEVLRSSNNRPEN